MTRISFIVPTFNRAPYIAEALQAIVSQMHGDDELLVIDDGSTDGTEAVVRATAPAAQYVRQENAGKSAALNRALAMTDGEYVWICDDDDVLRPGSVTLLYNRLSGSDAGFVFGKYTRFAESADGTRRDLGTGYWPDLHNGTLLRHILEDSFVMQNASLVRRSAYDRTGCFDETLPRSIDYDMAVRLALKVRADYVDEIIFDQRKHDGARGPAGNRHAAADSMKVWLDYDRRIFDRVAAETSLAEFEGLFEGSNKLAVRRAALIQRACVWGRHQRWPEALDDLQSASAIDIERPLHAVERAICRRILNGKHGFDELLSRQSATRVITVGQSSAIGRQIWQEMMAGGIWMLRRSPGRRLAILKVLAIVTKATRGVPWASQAGALASNDSASLRERRQSHMLPN